MQSSSQGKTSGGRSWALIWLIAGSVFLAAVASTELLWRRLGYRPSAVDSPALWKFWYDRAVHGGPRTIAIIGSSRIQAGISTQVLRDRLPGYRVVQLAKYATGSPVGVLRELAADEAFNGIVICDMIEPFLLRDAWDAQRELFEYEGRSQDGFEAIASAFVLEHLAIRSAESGVWAGIASLASRGTLPFSRHIHMPADRSLEFDFSEVKDLEQFTADKNESFRWRYEQLQMPPPEGLDPDIEQVQEFVRAIQDRGGQVVFLRMPSSGARLALEDEFHPKDRYWDRFAAATSGVCIYPTELAAGRAWSCPDESHLDYQDAIAFTDALVDDLLERGVVRAAPPRLDAREPGTSLSSESRGSFPTLPKKS